MELFIAGFRLSWMNQFAFEELIGRRAGAAHGLFMDYQHRNRVQIDHVHAHAICTEIGERLRVALIADATRLPSHLVRLTEQLDRAERREEFSGAIGARSLAKHFSGLNRFFHI